MVADPVLTVEQLAAFERQLLECRAPAVSVWAPGLSRAEMDALLQPYPELKFSDEARLWWGWHNGGPPNQAIIGGGDRSLFSLKDALDDYKFMRDYQEIPLLPIVGGQPYIYLEGASASPCRSRIFTEVHSESPRLATGSLGALVSAWQRLIDVGAWAYNTEFEGFTERVLERVPDDLWRVS